LTVTTLGAVPPPQWGQQAMQQNHLWITSMIWRNVFPKLAYFLSNELKTLGQPHKSLDMIIRGSLQ
jgi:hypothetical protein